MPFDGTVDVCAGAVDGDTAAVVGDVAAAAIVVVVAAAAADGRVVRPMSLAAALETVAVAQRRNTYCCPTLSRNHATFFRSISS